MEFSRFINRFDAGRQLARRLEKYRDENPIVLGLPRGGVVLGYPIAEALDAPLDVIVARKVGAPMQPELGIGAVAPGITLADRETIRYLGITDEEFESLAEAERAEMRRRLRTYRGSDELPDLHGRTAILVDDGLATGVTATAAVHALRALEPRRVVLAVGVCALPTAEALSDLVDDLVCIAMPDPFYAVGMWYTDFSQTTDEEVIDLLEQARLHRHS
jgi:putative phosphoribosyl transferase